MPIDLFSMFFVLLFFLFSLIGGESPSAASNSPKATKKEDAQKSPAKKEHREKKNTSPKSTKDRGKEVPKGEIKDPPKDEKHHLTEPVQQLSPEKKPLEASSVSDDHSMEQAPHPIKGGAQKLPLPRYVCLKATAVNMHVGPGDQYPVEWRYVKQFLPIEVLAEFDHWRQVRDIQGTVGWVHKTLLSSKRFAMVQNKVVNLYKEPNLESRVMVTVEPGVVCKLVECNANLCHVDIQGIRGWIKRDFLFGVYPDEMRF